MERGFTAAKIGDVIAQEGVFQQRTRAQAGFALLPTIRHVLRSGQVGFYNRGGLIDLRVPFFTQLVTGIYDGSYATGKSLVLHTPPQAAPPTQVFDALMAVPTDGLIVKTDPNDPLVPLLQQAPRPVIAVVDALPGIPSVVSDDLAGACAIAAHLASKGHQRVFFQRSDVPHTSVERRLAAMQAEGNLGDLQIEVGDVPDTEAGGLCDALRDALARPPDARPTAVVCWDDRNAMSVVAGCRALGIRVPGDVAVVGYDDGAGDGHVLAEGRRLTTVRAEWGAVARQAVYCLTTLLDGGELPPETVLPCRLISGDTT